MKKVLSLILALVMCLSLFACSNEESKPTAEETKTTVEEAKSTAEEVKKLTLDDIKAMSIVELAKLKVEDVNHLSAAELKIASKTFDEKKMAATEKELKEYINEFYLKEHPEFAPLAEDVVKLFYVVKQTLADVESGKHISDENQSILNSIRNKNYDAYDDAKLKSVISLAMTDPTDFSQPSIEYFGDDALRTYIDKIINSIVETPAFFS